MLEFGLVRLSHIDQGILEWMRIIAAILHGMALSKRSRRNMKLSFFFRNKGFLRYRDVCLRLLFVTDDDAIHFNESYWSCIWLGIRNFNFIKINVWYTTGLDWIYATFVIGILIIWISETMRFRANFRYSYSFGNNIIFKVVDVIPIVVLDVHLSIHLVVIRVVQGSVFPFKNVRFVLSTAFLADVIIFSAIFALRGIFGNTWWRGLNLYNLLGWRYRIDY
jgi:hypothetical protein